MESSEVDPESLERKQKFLGALEHLGTGEGNDV